MSLLQITVMKLEVVRQGFTLDVTTQVWPKQSKAEGLFIPLRDLLDSSKLHQMLLISLKASKAILCADLRILLLATDSFCAFFFVWQERCVLLAFRALLLLFGSHAISLQSGMAKDSLILS